VESLFEQCTMISVPGVLMYKSWLEGCLHTFSDALIHHMHIARHA